MAKKAKSKVTVVKAKDLTPKKEPKGGSIAVRRR